MKLEYRLDPDTDWLPYSLDSVTSPVANAVTPDHIQELRVALLEALRANGYDKAEARIRDASGRIVPNRWDDGRELPQP